MKFKNMIKYSFLTIAMFGITLAPQALETSARQAATNQGTIYQDIEKDIEEMQEKLFDQTAELEAINACNAQHKFYAPEHADADSNNCVGVPSIAERVQAGFEDNLYWKSKVTVTFPKPFATVPKILISQNYGYWNNCRSDRYNLRVSATNITTTQFVLNKNIQGTCAASTGVLEAYWIAIVE